MLSEQTIRGAVGACTPGDGCHGTGPHNRPGPTGFSTMGIMWSRVSGSPPSMDRP